MLVHKYENGVIGDEILREEYTYENASWGDQLTKVGSTTISYDEIGNPLTYNGYELTWSGRQLMAMDMNDAHYTFQYNDEGIRTSKISSSIEHRYTLNGSQIVSEAWVTKTKVGRPA